MQQTKAVAFSGVITALSFIVLMMTGMIPFGTFLFPTVAGLFVMSVRVEHGYRYAFICYLAVSCLALLFCPDKTAMIAFILLLGYYPLFKNWLEHKILSTQIRYSVKILLFSAACFAGFVLLFIFFPAELFAEGPLSNGILAIFFALGIITFFIYDIAINQILAYYIIKIKNRR